jgi:hypothetical protein
MKASALALAVTKSTIILDEVECSRFLTTFHSSAGDEPAEHPHDS